MSTYEELNIIINIAMLIVSILIYTNNKNSKKNNHPAAK